MVYLFNFLLYLIIAHLVCLCISSQSRCEFRDKCSFNEANKIPSCYCDPECVNYMDCCKEFISAQESGFGNASTPHDQDCVILTNMENEPQFRIGTFMMTRCKNTGHKCRVDNSSIEGLLPVTKHGITFLNSECAVCNSISDYESWNVVFDIPDQSVLLSSSKDGELMEDVSNEKVLEFVFNERSSSVIYHLLPSYGFHPRFCPFDLINYRQPGYDENIAQNVVRCGLDRALFKNVEKCVDDGCCLSKSPTCYEMDMKFLGMEGDKTSSSRGLQILMEMGSGQKGVSTDAMEKRLAPSLSYLDVKVMITLEVAKQLEVTQSVESCVQSAIVYLQYLNGYELESVARIFWQYTQLNGWPLFAIYVRSAGQLTIGKMNSLLHLNTTIHCEDRSSGESINFMMKGSTGSQVSVLESQGSSKQINYIKYGQYKKSSQTNFTSCVHVHLSLTKMDSGHTTVDMQCQDADETLAINGAQISQNRKIFPALIICLFLQVIGIM